MNHWYDRPTKTRYYQNGLDVTWYVMNNQPMPLSERFYPVEVK